MTSCPLVPGLSRPSGRERIETISDLNVGCLRRSGYPGLRAGSGLKPISGTPRRMRRDTSRLSRPSGRERIETTRSGHTPRSPHDLGLSRPSGRERIETTMVRGADAVNPANGYPGLRAGSGLKLPIPVPARRPSIERLSRPSGRERIETCAQRPRISPPRIAVIPAFGPGAD